MTRTVPAWRMIIMAGITAMVASCGSNRSSDWQPSPAPTHEDTLRATAYVGAAKCDECHSEQHTGWAATAHNQILGAGTAEEGYINDADLSGRADFFDGEEVDLAATAAAEFAVYGANAPRLGRDAAGPYLKIGAQTYHVAYTVGGAAQRNRTAADLDGNGRILNHEAQWRQNYITVIGNSHYVLPIQFNAATGAYVPYAPEDWYDDDYQPAGPALDRAYERLCAGCHVTGLQVSVDSSGEWRMTYAEAAVSCEACHGPGGLHVVVPTKDNILNPSTIVALEDQNGDIDLNDDALVDEEDKDIAATNALRRRNMVCSQCHSKGEGRFADAEGAKTAYPSRLGADGSGLAYLPGLDQNDYFTVTTEPEDFWGGEANTETGTFIAARSNHLQQQEVAAGTHAPGTDNDTLCISCHDLHSAAQPHLVTGSLTRDGLSIPTTNDDNTLCLACHAGQGDFANLNPAQVTEPAIAGPVVQNHMGRVLMAEVPYDPTSSQATGRCSTCHMPATGQSGTRDSNNLGDLHSHGFRIIWPNQNAENPDLAQLPNACNGCHYSGGIESGTAQVAAWSVSGHGDGQRPAWQAYDWDGNDTEPPTTDHQACQRCHTTTGAANFLAKPETYEPAANVFRLKPAANEVLYCRGCHTGAGTVLNDPGPVQADYTAAPHTFPDAKDSNGCLACHLGRESGDSIANSEAELSNTPLLLSHYLSGGAQIFSASGYHFADQDYGADPTIYAHDQIGMGTDARLADFESQYGTTGPCIGCHFSTPEPDSHLFRPVAKSADGVTISEITATVCQNCHASLAPASLEQAKAGLAALLAVLRDKLTATGFVFANNYPYFFNDNDNSYANRVLDWRQGASSKTIGRNNMGAAFNYLLVWQDTGAYAHNSRYAKRLLFDAIDWLDNATLDGTIDLSAYPTAAAYVDNDSDPGNDNQVGRP